MVVQGFRSSPSSSNLGSALKVVRQVDAKYPALLFKQQLTAYVEKIFGIIRDNLKKELTSLLSLCIQVSRILLAAFSSFSDGYSQPQSSGVCCEALFPILLKFTHLCNLLGSLSGTKNIKRSITIRKIVWERYSYKLLAKHHRKP